jgi:pre-rRNA-processing protein TSR3
VGSHGDDHDESFFIKIGFVLQSISTVAFIVIRHRKENRRKCSLRGLEERADTVFFDYPSCMTNGSLPCVAGLTLLDLDGEELTPNDRFPLILIDATWRYAEMMRKSPQLVSCARRRLPNGWKTAYPRCQTLCSDPERGLASIEALYAAATILGYPVDNLLDTYYWKPLFLEKNRSMIACAPNAAGQSRV